MLPYVYHGLKNNTRLTRFCDPTKKSAWDDVTTSQKIAVLQRCVWLLAEMHSSRAAFDLNNYKSGVNRHLQFCQFPKKSECAVCELRILTSEICSVWCHGLMNNTRPIQLTSEFFGKWQTACAYSLQIYDYLSQKQRETQAFLLIVTHNTEGPPFSDWQWRHRMLFFVVGLENCVNLVLFFEPWCLPYYLLIIPLYQFPILIMMY